MAMLSRLLRTSFLFVICLVLAVQTAVASKRSRRQQYLSEVAEIRARVERQLGLTSLNPAIYAALMLKYDPVLEDYVAYLMGAATDRVSQSLAEVRIDEVQLELAMNERLGQTIQEDRARLERRYYLLHAAVETIEIRMAQLGDQFVRALTELNSLVRVLERTPEKKDELDSKIKKAASDSLESLQEAVMLEYYCRGKQLIPQPRKWLRSKLTELGIAIGLVMPLGIGWAFNIQHHLAALFATSMVGIPTVANVAVRMSDWRRVRQNRVRAMVATDDLWERFLDPVRTLGFLDVESGKRALKALRALVDTEHLVSCGSIMRSLPRPQPQGLLPAPK